MKKRNKQWIEVNIGDSLYFHGTPICHDDCLIANYTTTQGHGILCFSLLLNQVQWMHYIDEFPSCYWHSPLIWQEYVLFFKSSEIQMLSLRSGECISQIPIGEGYFINSTSYAKGNRLWMAMIGNTLSCINLETQKLLFKYDAQGVILTDIAFANDRIFFPSVQAKNSEFHCIDSETGELIWKTEVQMLSFKSSLCVSNDKLYAIGFRFGQNISALLAINVKSGDIEEILPFSRFEDATFERYPGPICLADGILFSTFSGEVIYRQGSTIKWATPLSKSSVQLCYNPTKREIYFATRDGSIGVIGADTGEILVSEEVRDEFWARPIIYKGMPLYLSLRGKLLVQM